MHRFTRWASLVITCIAVSSTAMAAPKKKPAADGAPDFDKAAASSAITAITDGGLLKCKATNAAKGDGHVSITFSPAGSVENALIDKGPWVGTPVAKCMQREFKKAKVPAFKGDAITVGKSFHFE